MSNFEKRLEIYKPRPRCKGCVHYDNGDWDTDKCLRIECEYRGEDEGICMDDLEKFYDMGKADAIDAVLKIVYDICIHDLYCKEDMCVDEKKDCDACLYETIKNNLEQLKETK